MSRADGFSGYETSKSATSVISISVGFTHFQIFPLEKLRSHWAMECSTSNPLNCQMSVAQCLLLRLLFLFDRNMSAGLSKNVAFPIESMYGIFTNTWLFLHVFFTVNVDKYTIHGSYGICNQIWKEDVLSSE